jgi:hypothetical protein
VESLKADLTLIRDRSSAANLTRNEDLDDHAGLIREELEYIGLVLNFKLKAVRLAPKVLGKLGCTWDSRGRWTVRDFISHVCILFYCWNAVGRPFKMAKYQYILQTWARAQGEVNLETASLKATFRPPAHEDFWPLLEEWTLFALEGAYVEVPDPALAVPEYDYIICTDSSALMFAGIIVSLKSGQATIVSGPWPDEFAEDVKSSAFAEPLGLVGTCNSFFHESAHARCHYIGDNFGFVRQVDKGYTTTAGQFVMEYLARRFPNLTFSSSEHYEGSRIPMDEPSRGLEVDRDKLREFFDRLGINFPFIRVVQSAAPLDPN